MGDTSPGDGVRWHQRNASPENRELLYYLDSKPCTHQINQFPQLEYDPQLEVFKACCISSYQFFQPPRRTSEDIDENQRNLAIESTKQFVNEYVSQEMNHEWGSSSESDDPFIYHQNNTKNQSSTRYIRFIEALADLVPLSWGFHVFDPVSNPCCTCPCSRAVNPWREKHNIVLYDDETCKHKWWDPWRLMDHLKGKGDIYHLATKHYLDILYDNYFLERGKSLRTPRTKGNNGLDERGGVAEDKGAAKTDVDEDGHAAR
jgi:hypothetical protein